MLIDKYNRIDVNKLPAEVRRELAEIAHDTDGFKDEELNKVYEENFNTLYKLIEEKYPDAIRAKKKLQKKIKVKLLKKKSEKKLVKKANEFSFYMIVDAKHSKHMHDLLQDEKIKWEVEGDGPKIQFRFTNREDLEKAKKEYEHISTETPPKKKLVKKTEEIVGRGWGDYKKGKLLTADDLADLKKGDIILNENYKFDKHIRNALEVVGIRQVPGHNIIDVNYSVGEKNKMPYSVWDSDLKDENDKYYLPEGKKKLIKKSEKEKLTCVTALEKIQTEAKERLNDESNGKKVDWELFAGQTADYVDYAKEDIEKHKKLIAEARANAPKKKVSTIIKDKQLSIIKSAFKTKAIGKDHLRAVQLAHDLSTVYRKHGMDDIADHITNNAGEMINKHYGIGKAEKGAQLKVARTGVFTITGLPGKEFKGYTLNDDWNGWATPYFETAEAREIADLLQGRMIYDSPPHYMFAAGDEEKKGSFADFTDGPYEQQEIETTEGKKTVYPIGAYVWAWEEKGTAAKGAQLLTSDELMQKYSGKYIDVYPHHQTRWNEKENRYETVYEVRGVSKKIKENYNLPEDAIAKCGAQLEKAEHGAIVNQYRGKNPGQVWDEWNYEQRKHFLLDHLSAGDMSRKESDIKKIADKNWQEIYDIVFSENSVRDGVDYGTIYNALVGHVRDGQYARGGRLPKFADGEKVNVNDTGYVKLFSGFDTTRPATVTRIDKTRSGWFYRLEMADGQKPFNAAPESILSSAEAAKGAQIKTSDIVSKAMFKTQTGIVFIIDKVTQNDPDFGTVVETSMEGGAKGNYRDTIEEVVDFLNGEKSVKL